MAPVLANIDLHEVFDRWFEDVVRPRLRGRAFVVRFADDVMVVFRKEFDARRVMGVLPKRFGRFGLRLHPRKTRLVEFHQPRLSQQRRGPGQGTFDLLGFTHFWARSRKGTWVVKRKTARDRFKRVVRELGQWCRTNRHLPVAIQHHLLSAKLRGHDAYYGILGNWHMIRRLRWELLQIWQRWLSHRSQRGMRWEAFYRMLERYPLPRPRVVHKI